MIKVEVPDTIKVGGISYSVKLVDHLPHEEVGYKWGECDYQTSTIKIWNGLSNEKQEQTLIHEVTHAIAHEAGIDDQDEDLINRFALVLYQVLKENQFNEKPKSFHEYFYDGGSEIVEEVER